MAAIARTPLTPSKLRTFKLQCPQSLLLPSCIHQQIPRRTPRASRRTFNVSTAYRKKYYTDAHEWVELSEDGKTGVIGISNYAAKALGDVVFVELPALNLEVQAKDAIGAVESVKSASDIYSPVGGKIIEANSMLEEKPGTINKGAENEGWIAKLEVLGKVKGLMDEEEYKEFTAE